MFENFSMEWKRIPQKDIDHLILSMPGRCRAVIKNRGDHTLCENNIKNALFSNDGQQIILLSIFIFLTFVVH